MSPQGCIRVRVRTALCLATMTASIGRRAAANVAACSCGTDRSVTHRQQAIRIHVGLVRGAVRTHVPDCYVFHQFENQYTSVQKDT